MPKQHKSFNADVARAFERFCAERNINPRRRFGSVTLYGMGGSSLTVRPQDHNFGDGRAPLLLPDEINPW